MTRQSRGRIVEDERLSESPLRKHGKLASTRRQRWKLQSQHRCIEARGCFIRRATGAGCRRDENRYQTFPPSSTLYILCSSIFSVSLSRFLRSTSLSHLILYFFLSATIRHHIFDFFFFRFSRLSLSLSLSLCFIVSAFFLPSSLVHWALYFTFYGRRWGVLDQKKWPEGCEIVLVLSVFLNAKWDINGRIFGSLDREEFLWNSYQWWKICLECKYGAFLDAIWFLYDSSLSPYESL